MVEVKTTNTSYTSHKRSLSSEKINLIHKSLEVNIQNIISSNNGLILETTLKQIIKSLYDEFICKPITIELIEKFTSQIDNAQKEYYLGWVDEIYNTGSSFEGDLEDLKKNTNLDNDNVCVFEKCIKKEKVLDYLKEITGTDTAVIISAKKKKVIKELTKILNKKT
ncbi:hypothetical protein ALNOE001_06530 [Candidatus Methanobinarius endosymbioticus]|uniref:Uncharacterized protein n=1 Tax=Candidatus Methanobinarius endosymbioticus TaxID=2006182 RepID=A0A366MC86_9EURY|nr:hypothetical protein ALNOE001_06530 [Candidatus Methanobinarius endosymbioticus]